MSSHLEGFRIKKPINGIDNKQTSKKEKFGEYKEPHSQLGCFLVVMRIGVLGYMFHK
jgi:hypothetical protein